MKKSPNQTTQRRKLVLRREAVAQLTSPELGQVTRAAAAIAAPNDVSFLGPPCHINSAGVALCAGQK